MNCPHCDSEAIERCPGNERLFFCRTCIMPSLEEGGYLRAVLQEDVGRLIGAFETNALLIWLVKNLALYKLAGSQKPIRPVAVKVGARLAPVPCDDQSQREPVMLEDGEQETEAIWE